MGEFGRLRWARVVGLIGVLWLLYAVSLTVNTPKMLLSNDENYAFLTRTIARVPSDAYVFDLVGSTIYFEDPYYVSGVPFGQWMPYLSRPLPDLSAALKQTKTKFIYRDPLGRVDKVLTVDSIVYDYLQ